MSPDSLSRLKTVLAGRTAREVAVFGVFLFFSATAWFLQVLHENYEIEIDIPLQLTDVPEDVVIIDSLSRDVQVKVGDRGTTLFSSFYLSRPSAVSISFADFNTANNVGDVQINMLYLQKHIQAVLPATTTIQHVTCVSPRFSYNREVR